MAMRSSSLKWSNFGMEPRPRSIAVADVLAGEPVADADEARAAGAVAFGPVLEQAFAVGAVATGAVGEVGVSVAETGGDFEEAKGARGFLGVDDQGAGGGLEGGAAPARAGVGARKHQRAGHGGRCPRCLVERCGDFRDGIGYPGPPFGRREGLAGEGSASKRLGQRALLSPSRVPRSPVPTGTGDLVALLQRRPP